MSFLFTIATKCPRKRPNRMTESRDPLKLPGNMHELCSSNHDHGLIASRTQEEQNISDTNIYQVFCFICFFPRYQLVNKNSFYIVYYPGIYRGGYIPPMIHQSPRLNLLIHQSPRIQSPFTNHQELSQITNHQELAYQ